MRPADAHAEPPLAEIVREWGRIGCLGFGGPPVHIELLRELCVTRRAWLTDTQFERALAASNLLPGPASTQLAIYCAWRLRGRLGAILGGLAFILPGLVLILVLASLFLSGSPPSWVRGAGAGSGAALAAVAVRAGLGVARPIWAHAAGRARRRALADALAGAIGAALTGPWLVLVLLACGAVELGRVRLARGGPRFGSGAWLALALAPVHLAPGRWRALLAVLAAPAGAPALVWTSIKVGALAFGGGFVIVPLMQSDAVSSYHWMSHAQFLDAVVLGQVTPGPVIHTVAAVGYSAAGLAGGMLAALAAFVPSFGFVLIGAARFERLLIDARVGSFLAGAAPASAGAIVGAAVPLAGALSKSWQYALLAAAAVALLGLRTRVLPTLLVAAGAGAAVALLGGAIPR